MIKKLAVAAVLSVAFSTPGFADMAYAPAELSTDNGALDVYQRIQVAAKRTCDNRLNHDSVIKYHKVRDRCVSDVVAELVHKVNDPRLDKIHNEHKAGI